MPSEWFNVVSFKGGIDPLFCASAPVLLKGMVPDDAVEALAGRLGKREADPEDGKPVEDKVKVMAAQILLEGNYHWSPSVPK